MKNNKGYDFPEGLLGMDIDDVEAFLNTEFERVTLVDEKIADGCDDGQDEYVMMRSYDVEQEGNVMYVRFFFGNNTRTVASWHVI